MIELVVLNGVCAGTVFPVPNVPTVLGRSQESHLQVGDPWISNMHALFERRGDEIWVVDLDSRNGTWIEERRVREARVPPGAIVRFGRTEARLVLRPDDDSATPDALPLPEPHEQSYRETIRTDPTFTDRAIPVHPGPPRPDAGADPGDALVPRVATILRIAIDTGTLDVSPGAPERLRAAVEAVSRATLEAGAVVTRLGGTGLLAVFGFSAPDPHDPDLALGAARAARRAVRAQRGFDLRAAVDSGPILAGNAAAGGGFELVAVGAPADRAERLVALARRGEILAGPGAARASGLVRLGVQRVADLEIEVFRDERE